MKQRLRYSIKYLKYILFSKHKKGHGIHSPFMFTLITQIFNRKKPDEKLREVFLAYDKIIKSKEILQYDEIGAGSSYPSHKKQFIRKIVKRSSLNKKYGQLLYNLVNHFKPHQILELGTSVGISTTFISQAAPNSVFRTIEGIPEKIAMAKKITSELKLHPEFIEGNFDHILDSVLENYQTLDFVFFDGNHTQEATLNYFNKCISKANNNSMFVFDDIHWSNEMEHAWDKIKAHNKVKVSIDLFRLGLIFFKVELSNQHYVIKF